MKALVTCGADFIGSHDANALISLEELIWIPKVSINYYLN